MIMMMSLHRQRVTEKSAYNHKCTFVSAVLVVLVTVLMLVLMFVCLRSRGMAMCVCMSAISTEVLCKDRNNNGEHAETLG